MRFSIVKREPSFFFENIHEDLNRFLKDTFGDIEFMDKAITPAGRMFRPAIEVKEEKDKYKIKVELPNVKKEDIDIELCENAMSIMAEAKYEECSEEENLKTSEFRYGKFSRTIPFDAAINVDDAKSEFKDGILRIVLPKKYPGQEDNVKKLHID